MQNKSNLESDSSRSVKLLKAEGWLVRFEIIGMILISIYLIFTGETTLDPFYLPLFWPLMVFIIGFLIISLQYIVFRWLEIKSSDSKVSKFKIAENSMKKTITVFIVSLIAFAIVFVPFFVEQVEGIYKRDGQIEGFTESTIEFTSRANLDFLYAEEIKLQVVDQELEDPVRIFIVRKEDYVSRREDYGPDELLNHNNTLLYDEFKFDMLDEKFGEYKIVMQTDEDVAIQYELNYIFPDYMTDYLSYVFLIFSISNFIGAVLFYSIKRKHTDRSDQIKS